MILVVLWTVDPDSRVLYLAKHHASPRWLCKLLSASFNLQNVTEPKIFEISFLSSIKVINYYGSNRFVIIENSKQYWLPVLGFYSFWLQMKRTKCIKFILYILLFVNWWLQQPIRVVDTVERITQQNTLSLSASGGFDQEKSASSNLKRENLVTMMQEATVQWNLFSGLERGIMSRKSIESRQDSHDLDAAQGMYE